MFSPRTQPSRGFRSISPELITKYLDLYAQDINIDVRDILALGRQNANDEKEEFNMAYLALRGSGAVNGVSRLHGDVSRELFQSFFPRWPREEVPIGHVTNGVHVPTWDSSEADKLWDKVCGKDRWMGLPRSKATEHMRGVSDAELWQLRSNARAQLVHYSRRRLARELAASGAPAVGGGPGRTHLRSGHINIGLCAPVRHL
jgi:starch phosphorylase